MPKHLRFRVNRRVFTVLRSVKEHLVFWNGISPGGDEEFLSWHVSEHIPERVSVPGFLRGRRYVAHDGIPRYFNFYETETLEVLHSPRLPRAARPSDALDHEGDRDLR